MILTVIVTVLIFGVLITTHELGHFIAARKCGVIVEEFSIGMGPLLFERKGSDNTVYSLRLLPIGGYCKMYGEDEDEDIAGEGSLNWVSPWKRIIILAAGAMTNLLSALLILMLVYAINGTEPTTTIGNVIDNSPAYHAGIESGDTIIKADNTDIDSWESLAGSIDASKGRQITLTLRKEDDSV